MPVKSPFKVYQEFLSPKLCDDIIAKTKLDPPNKDADGNPLKYECYNDHAEGIIFQKLKNIIPELEEHYDIDYVGTERMLFQSFPEGMNKPAEEPGCQNAKYLRKKWVKIKDVDLTAVLWLKDYQDQVPFDNDNEVFGGKLELPMYNFSLVPQKGTLVVYPAGPHFITATSPVMVGTLSQVRINLTVKQPWLYDPTNFQGSYVEWFKEYS